ncbi:putative dipeptidase C3A11.10c [Grifola frondosa]|uniref:Dipeptidase n=1 Tax=Grifola frondosa TaxID=5627 RepID=A0A1C7LR53_GRIFR|nr:putative dipeptidase C3A11.10c [Grifola frondosa]
MTAASWQSGEGNLARDTDYNPLDAAAKRERRATSVRAVVYGALTILFVVVLLVMLFFWEGLGGYIGALPKDPQKAAQRLLEAAPVIVSYIIILCITRHDRLHIPRMDTSANLPILARSIYSNNVSAIDLNQPMPGHVDIPRLREGKVGGFFWSTYVACPAGAGLDEGEDYLNATWRVRDTLEQIDVAQLLISKYPETFSLALSSADVKLSISRGKIASLIGVEGGHQLGNSIAVLRQYFALGVRYVTLTHVCHNAFADSCGLSPGMEPRWGGLSPLGFSLIEEMNRLGVLVDLSHTSDETAKQALKYTKAPVIWSHSSARAVYDVPRNVPDDVLEMIGIAPDKTDAVVMVNFAPHFVAEPGNATVQTVADHVDHIAKIAGKKHVGLGSDFDGISDVPVGLEDVSKYPALIAELYKRGWNRFELVGLTGRNLLRIMDKAERTAAELQTSGMVPIMALYDKRKDL